jgi:hypothetical protein
VDIVTLFMDIILSVVTRFGIVGEPGFTDISPQQT